MSKEQKEKNLPDWARASFAQFITQSGRLHDITRLSRNGISAALDHPERLKRAMKFFELHGHENGKVDDPLENAKQLEYAERDSELVRREIDAGYPFLYFSAIVSLWSLLEAMTRSIIVAWLKNDRDIIQGAVLSKLRVRIGDYEQLSQEERYHYIAEVLETEVAAGLRCGIDRFEALFKCVGLDGDSPQQLRRHIY
ncbi:MAG: hypothetical protein ABIU05_17520, partial [Nitrospirales bacterium]